MRLSPSRPGYQTHPQVRPFVLATGRTRAPARYPLLVHTIVSAPSYLPAGAGLLAPQEQVIYGLARQRMSVAEISAHSRIAIGVVRVVLGDLARRHLIAVHPATESVSGPASSVTLRLLERVLSGLQEL